MPLDQIEIFNNDTKAIINGGNKPTDIFTPTPHIRIHVSASVNTKPNDKKELKISEDYPF